MHAAVMDQHPKAQTVMQSVVSPTAIPATTLMSIDLSLVTVTPAHTILQCVRQSTGALSAGLCVLEGPMHVSTLR